MSGQFQDHLLGASGICPDGTQGIGYFFHNQVQNISPDMKLLLDEIGNLQRWKWIRLNPDIGVFLIEQSNLVISQIFENLED